MKIENRNGTEIEKVELSEEEKAKKAEETEAFWNFKTLQALKDQMLMNKRSAKNCYDLFRVCFFTPKKRLTDEQQRELIRLANKVQSAFDDLYKVLSRGA